MAEGNLVNLSKRTKSCENNVESVKTPVGNYILYLYKDSHETFKTFGITWAIPQTLRGTYVGFVPTCWR